MKSRVLFLTLLVLFLFIAGYTLKENILSAKTSQEVNIQEPKSSFFEPDEGDFVWFFSKSKDELGSGGELQIFLDHQTYPDAHASFAKFNLGVGGALPMHKHEKTEEIAYILSGEGIALYRENGETQEMPISAGYVWYNPPSSWHSVRNTSDEPLSMVFATIPNEEKGLLSFFRKIGAKPGEEAKKLSTEEFGRIAAEHDLILRPPDPHK